MKVQLRVQEEWMKTRLRWEVLGSLPLQFPESPQLSGCLCSRPVRLCSVPSPAPIESRMLEGQQA